MQHPIGKNDPNIFSTAKENQYLDRKSARKDTKEIPRSGDWWKRTSSNGMAPTPRIRRSTTT